jgi:hypothetical protein
VTALAPAAGPVHDAGMGDDEERGDDPVTDEEARPAPYRAPPGTCLHGRLPELCPACGEA